MPYANKDALRVVRLSWHTDWWSHCFRLSVQKDLTVCFGVWEQRFVVKLDCMFKMHFKVTNSHNDIIKL